MGFQHNLRLTLVSLFVLGLGTLLLAQLISPVAAQGDNLLTNPGFEGQYSPYIPQTPEQQAACSLGICQTANVPDGWLPWWVNQQPGDEGWKNRMPEWKPAEQPFANRIRSGERAMQYFSYGGTHIAGALQTVTVPANAQLEYTVWGQAWSREWGDNNRPAVCINPTQMNMRIGIDPNGGTNPWSPDIVWSGTASPCDVYSLFSVQATANGDKVTVFMYSAPAEPRENNDVYWDEAALRVVGQGAPPPPAQNNDNSAPPAAPVQYVPGPTPTPDADGVIKVQVQPGDSLWAIAARAGLTLDELLELNNMSKDEFLTTGQTIIIGYGDPSGGEEVETSDADTADAAEATPEPDSADDAAEGDEAAAEDVAAADADAPEEVAAADDTEMLEAADETEEMMDSGICLTAFEDLNQNAQQDAGEPLAPAVVVTISNDTTVISNYITDGASEPYCIRGLEEGSYRVTRSHSPTEQLTTPGDWAIMLSAGSTVDVAFGSVAVEPEAAVAVAEASGDTTAAEDVDAAATAGEAALEQQAAATPTGTNQTMLIAGIAVIALIAVGLGAVAYRRLSG